MSQPVPAPEPTPRKKGGCLKIAAISIIGILVLFALLGACSAMFASDDSAPPPSTETAPEDPQVVGPPPEPAPEPDPAPSDTLTLTATSTGDGTVMWGDLDGSSHSESFTGTWTLEVPDDDSITTLYVSGDFMSDNQEVTCTITKGGEQIDAASGSGSAGSAHCSEPLF